MARISLQQQAAAAARETYDCLAAPKGALKLRVHVVPPLFGQDEV